MGLMKPLTTAATIFAQPAGEDTVHPTAASRTSIWITNSAATATNTKTTVHIEKSQLPQLLPQPTKQLQLIIVSGYSKPRPCLRAWLLTHPVPSRLLEIATPTPLPTQPNHQPPNTHMSIYIHTLRAILHHIAHRLSPYPCIGQELTTRA